MNQYEAIQNFSDEEPGNNLNSHDQEEIKTIHQLRVSLFMKMCPDKVNFKASSMNEIEFFTQHEECSFFSIRPKQTENGYSWASELSIEVELTGIELYQNGSLILSEPLTPNQMHERLSLENVTNLFRAIDNIFY